MSIVRLKNLPGLKLTDLLRRKKKTLEKFINEFGITTYESLLSRCDRIGVLPPPVEDFEEIVTRPVSSPMEGVVVLKAPPVVNEHTGKIVSDGVNINLNPDTGKKTRKKRVDLDEARDFQTEIIDTEDLHSLDLNQTDIV
jgi:hypothetical protein